jgi:hypothetical protein
MPEIVKKDRVCEDNPLPYKIITFTFGVAIWIVGSFYKPTPSIAIYGFLLMVIGGVMLAPYVYYIILEKMKC